MKITTNHPESAYGMPVILDDEGEVIAYAEGIDLIRQRLGLTAGELAEVCGVKKRTVDGWAIGRIPSAQSLNMLGQLIECRSDLMEGKNGSGGKKKKAEKV